MEDERLKEMMRTYDVYGSSYGREVIGRMLEEECSKNVEEILNAVGSEPLEILNISVNRNMSDKEVIMNFKTESEGIV